MILLSDGQSLCWLIHQRALPRIDFGDLEGNNEVSNLLVDLNSGVVQQGEG